MMVLLLGDWVPELSQPMLNINTMNEFVLMNLEGPILANPLSFVPAIKSGPHLYSTHLPDIQNAAAVCFSLANNHIKDYGWSAVQVTQARLIERNFYSVGVGENEQLAREPLQLTVGESRYAIFSLCEIQAGRATSVQPGSATIGPWIYQAIKQIRSEVDIVIVSVHAANEFLPWPSPLEQDLYRSFIDAGANIVHGHHSHVPQGVESYKNGLICYGLGNFMASPTRYNHFETQRSIGVRIECSSGQIYYQIEPYCFRQIDQHIVVEEEKSDRFKSYIVGIQEPLVNRPLLEALWQETALWLYDKYGRDSIGLPSTIEKMDPGNLKRYLISLAKGIKRRYAMSPNGVHQNQILWYNIFACLSHRHMMETALGLLSGELTDVRNTQSRELVAAFLPQLLK